MRRIELLAPARNCDVAIVAVNSGADAIYMGAEGFGARSAACNSINDVARAVEYAHKFNVRVYVTFNTLVHDHELRQAESMIRQLYRAGVDALIIQDLGILRMDIPPIELHASTQCDIRTAGKAAFLESLGFSQLVLARELSHGEIAEIRGKTRVRLEAFVHGALCVSYSGRCQVSHVLKGRSANRGECAQICRLPFDLVDDRDNVLVRSKHLLSLRDLNLADRLTEMMSAGVDSFKIEGRLKDAGYVRNVVACYRRAIDSIISKNTGNYRRTSCGTAEIGFMPDLHKSFNRRFTHYFFDNRDLQNDRQIAAIDTPKSMGERAGQVTGCNGKRITVSSPLRFNNGDGISYFDRNGNYTGFHVNRAEGNILILPQPVNISVGTPLYRTYNKQFEDDLNCSKSERKIVVDFHLRVVGDTLVLDAHDERGNNVTCSALAHIELSEKPQAEKQRAVLSKTGGTIYKCGRIDVPKNMFVPPSLLAGLRRKVTEALDRAQRVNYRYGYRLPEDVSAQCFTRSLTYADNVANKLSRRLYREHGVAEIEPALEVSGIKSRGMTVMHTRYCIRRELGICLKTNTGQKSSRRLFLRHGETTLALHFDCNHCEMQVKLPD